MSKVNSAVLKSLLIFLITLLPITGLFFLDDMIWNIVMILVAALAYAIVGTLFSLGVIGSRIQGSEAFKIVFIVLLVIGLFLISIFLKIQTWIMTWPLWVKIFIPSLMVCSIISILVVLLSDAKNQRKKYDRKFQK